MSGIYRKGKTFANAGLQIIDKTQEKFEQIEIFEDTFYRVKNETIIDGVYIPEKDVVFDFETEAFHINYIDNTDFDYLFSIIHFVKTNETTENGIKTIEYNLDPNYADAVNHGNIYEPELTSLKFIVTGNLDHTGEVELTCVVVYDGMDYRDSSSFENGDLLTEFPSFNNGEFYYFVNNVSTEYNLYIGSSANNTATPIDSDLLEYITLKKDPDNENNIIPIIDAIENKIYLGTYRPYDEEYNYFEQWYNDHYYNINLDGIYGSNVDDETHTVTFFPFKQYIDASWSESFLSISSVYSKNNIITSIVVTETNPENFETEWKVYVGGELYSTTTITGENEPVILNKILENPLYIFSDSSEQSDPPMKAYIGNKAFNLLLDIPTTDEIEALFKQKGELIVEPEQFRLVKSESTSQIDTDADFIIEESAINTLSMDVIKLTEYEIELSIDGYINDPSTIKTGNDLLCSFILYRKGINGRLYSATYGFLTFSNDKYIVPVTVEPSDSEHYFYTNWFKLYANIPSDFKFNEQGTQRFHGTLRFVVVPIH